MISRNPKIFSAEESKGKFGIWESEPSIYSIPLHVVRNLYSLAFCAKSIYSLAGCAKYTVYSQHFLWNLYITYHIGRNRYIPLNIVPNLFSLEYCAKSIFPCMLCKIYIPLHIVGNPAGNLYIPVHVVQNDIYIPLHFVRNVYIPLYSLPHSPPP